MNNYWTLEKIKLLKKCVEESRDYRVFCMGKQIGYIDIPSEEDLKDYNPIFYFGNNDDGRANERYDCSDNFHDFDNYRPIDFTVLWSRKPLPLVFQRLPAKRTSEASETAGSPLG